MLSSTSVAIASNGFSKWCVGDVLFGHLSGCRSRACHGHVLQAWLRIIPLMWDSDSESESKVEVDVMRDGGGVVVVENDELAVVQGPIHVELRVSVIGLAKYFAHVSQLAWDRSRLIICRATEMYIVSNNIFIEALCSVQCCEALWLLWLLWLLWFFYGLTFLLWP